MTSTSRDPGGRIRRIGGVMSVVTAVIATFVVAAYVWIFLDPAILAEAIRSRVRVSGGPIPLTPNVTLVLFGVGLVPLAVTLFALWNAFLLFRGYRDGVVFSEAAGRWLRRMGAALAAMPFAGAFFGAAGSVLVTMNNPAGERQFALSIGSDDLILGIAGAMLIVIGWVMVEAARIADENRQFV